MELNTLNFEYDIAQKKFKLLDLYFDIKKPVEPIIPKKTKQNLIKKMLGYKKQETQNENQELKQEQETLGQQGRKDFETLDKIITETIGEKEITGQEFGEIGAYIDTLGKRYALKKETGYGIFSLSLQMKIKRSHNDLKKITLRIYYTTFK